MVVSRRGHILTNLHVVAFAPPRQPARRQLAVTFYKPDGDPAGPAVPAEIVDVDPAHDLALLRVTSEDDARRHVSVYQSIRRDAAVAFGARVVAVGVPDPGDAATPSFHVARVTREWIRVDDPITPGQSGSAVYDAATGALVGIATATDTFDCQHRDCQGWVRPISFVPAAWLDQTGTDSTPHDGNRGWAPTLVPGESMSVPGEVGTNGWRMDWYLIPAGADGHIVADADDLDAVRLCVTRFGESISCVYRDTDQIRVDPSTYGVDGGWLLIELEPGAHVDYVVRLELLPTAPVARVDPDGSSAEALRTEASIAARVSE